MLLLLFLVSHTRVVCDVPRGTRYVASTWNVYRFYLEPTYNSNYIFAEPIKDVKDATLVEAFQKVFETLEEWGMKPTLNITDNQAVKPIKAFLASKDCKC